MKQKTLLLLGNSGVGKSSLTNRLKGQPNAKLSTIGVDCSFYHGRDYKIKCWDVSGSSRFNFLVNDFVKDADVIALVCTKDDIASVCGLKRWFEGVEEALEHKQLVIFVTQSAEQSFLSLDDIKHAIRAIPYQALYEVGDPLSLFKTFDGLASDEAGAGASPDVHLENYSTEKEVPSDFKCSAMLLSIEKQLLLILKKTKPHFFHKTPIAHAALNQLLVDIKRGIESDIGAIKERLLLINIKETWQLINIIEANEEELEMDDLSHVLSI